MNVLIVSAHHDDLELGCGGSVAKLIEKGHRVVSLVLTHSGYRDPGGKVIRKGSQALKEGRSAAAALGYRLIAFKEDTLDLELSDANVRKILLTLDTYEIDTVFTHWSSDTHPAHRRAHALTLQACRRVPRLFCFASNCYIGDAPFHPTAFIPIEERHWRLKIEALKRYRAEFARTGRSWTEYLDRQTLNFGTQIGVPRAEGFVTVKNLWEI